MPSIIRAVVHVRNKKMSTALMHRIRYGLTIDTINCSVNLMLFVLINSILGAFIMYK